ncbi:MAG: phycobiliprotein lyase [Cyanobacteria bacterium J083]|nr:MAG: phycobiliprotein lyase [Cyanobacteria bacterium J083]
MDIAKFVELSLGTWRSQRSAHHLAFQHFEEVTSQIEIVPLSLAAKEVIDLCNSYGIDPSNAKSPFRMSWQGESDWDEDEVKGTTILVPLPAANQTNQGRLIRERGYAETMPAIANYSFLADGTFVLKTEYEHATAEEKIWFATPNLRFRVSLIKTSKGSGVTTASFSSEIRSL